ncbi:MAG: NUDIX domain-containing protein [Variovorax sp.]
MALLKKALETAPQVAVAIGSAFQARSPKNPFSWEERAGMIRAALSDTDRARVVLVPVRDHVDDARWFAEVRERIDAALVALGQAPSSAASTVIVGHVKDPTREYLLHFDGWALQASARAPAAEAAAVRDAVFGMPPDAPGMLAGMLPKGTFDFVRSWMAGPRFDALAQEWALLKQHDADWSVAPYPVVLVTVDCVVKCRGRVLVIRRGRAPGKGLAAMPGGFLELRETTLQSVLRELEEETHLDVPATDLLACLSGAEVFDRPDRSQRGRTITHGFFFDLGDRDPPQVRADDDAQSVEWMPIEALCAFEEEFLDDHFQMLDHFLGLLPRPVLGD